MLGYIFLFLYLLTMVATLVEAIRGKMSWEAAIAVIGGLGLFIALVFLACSDGKCPDLANNEWYH